MKKEIEKPWTLYWLKKMQKEEGWANLRFKQLITNSGYPQFTMPEERIDRVDHEAFMKDEPDRLPLFIGTQFGVAPWYPLQGNGRGLKAFAVLGQSGLSGVVAGVRVYSCEKGVEELVIDFRNEENV